MLFAITDVFILSKLVRVGVLAETYTPRKLKQIVYREYYYARNDHNHADDSV